jgi:hypothetical protein
MCLEAVRQNGQALRYVPESLRTETMCFDAVRQNGQALEYIPELLRTEAICLEAVRQNGQALKYVPESLMTEDICFTAVQNEGQAICDVPEFLKTEKICITAVKQNGYALRNIPKKATIYDPGLPVDFVFNHFLFSNCQYGFKGPEISSLAHDLHRYLEKKQKAGDIDNITLCEKLDELDKKLEKLKDHFRASP